MTQKEVQKQVGWKITERSADLISRIESGRIHPSEKIFLKILTKGFDLSEIRAKEILGKWFFEELAQKYGYQITFSEKTIFAEKE